jgi:predicted small lipoprotein YifL
MPLVGEEGPLYMPTDDVEAGPRTGRKISLLAIDTFNKQPEKMSARRKAACEEVHLPHNTVLRGAGRWISVN